MSDTRFTLSPDFTLGVVGAGLMGGGIAQVAARGGVRTLLFDSRKGAAAGAKEKIAATFQQLIGKGKMTGADAEKALACLELAASLKDLAGCDAVIEAIVEDLEAKKALFAELEKIVRAECVLATNTSSLSVTAIAAACEKPGRVAGFHFFSPVPLMKLVEVIAGVRSDKRVTAILAALAASMGHTAVRAKDTPGFIVNHAGRGYGTEALRILSENVAEFHTVDRILCDGAGFRMGPFELMDLTGLDVSQPVMESIYHQYYEEPRFRPTPLLWQRKQAGLLGRKTGEGFYQYADGAREEILLAAAPTERPTSIWLSRRDAQGHAAVLALLAKLGANVETGEHPSAEALCLVTPLGRDATSSALIEGLDPSHTIAIDAWFGLDTHRTLMATPVTNTASRKAALGLFQSDGAHASLIRDSGGFVAQRVIAHIVNVACDIAQQGIATPADIDKAVTLGLGYRQGPLAMGDAIGAARVLAILEALQDFYGDPRYRPSPWLKRRALLGLSLTTPEN